MIIHNNQLDESQLKALDQLSSQCLQADGGHPTLYKHLLEQQRVSDNNLLYFKNNELIGFLSIFFFYEDACEVALMVSPQHRKQGIAIQLLNAIMPRFLIREITGLIFSTPSGVNDTWLSKLGFLYKCSDSQMQRHGSDPIAITNERLVIRAATAADASIMCEIDASCFAQQQPNLAFHLNELLVDEHYSLIIALYNEVIIGKAHIHWRLDDAVFSDIAILPTYQGQGLGSELVIHCINQSVARGKAIQTLDVEAENDAALNLYKRHGFKVTIARDYWFIPLNRLQQHLMNKAP